MGEKYDALLARLGDIHNLNRANAVLSWDRETQMPPDGAQARGRQMQTLSRITHEMFTSDETQRLLEEAEREIEGADYDSIPASMVRIVRRDLQEAIKVPAQHVSEFSKLTSDAHHSWIEARATNDFSRFEGDLERIVEMLRQETEYLGYADVPYDALLGKYERAVTTAQVKALFDGHRQELVELVAAIQSVAGRVDDAVLRQHFPQAEQDAFCRKIATAVGYNFRRGRLDVSVHPFSISFSNKDSRITTRFNDNWLSPALFGTLHECGHSMYEQGIPDEISGTMIGRGTSLGVHESQSRTWENLVGRSKGFWVWALPLLKEQFPQQIGDITLEDFYKAINKSTPSFIRVEADEVNYNLHIMLRFEIEQQLIHGQLAVKDVPQAWNSLFEESFGMLPNSNTNGCLQDIHWSMGALGYFATYALGNLLGAQYYNQAVQDAPSIPSDIENGRFETLLNWQRENLHQHGRKYNADELTRRVTGEGIQSQPYVAYLKRKYSEVYGL
ncbi:MAG: carboxypeptidase M32 [Phototrophicaceae bacterium]